MVALALLAAVLVAALSPASALAANSPPKITKQPANLTVEEGQPASFTATASGTPAPTVQWELSTNAGTSWSPIEGATGTTLTIASAITAENGYQFRAVFTNVAGTVTSKAATLTVHRAPFMIEQPQSITAEEGQNVTFQSSAGGTPAPTAQWQTSGNGGTTWSNITGATSNQLMLSAVKTTLSGHLYRVIYKNGVGSVTSEAATLTVQKAPAITLQPTDQTAEPGQNATFEASASGFPTPSVQWEVSTDGGSSWTPIEGATSTQLVVENVQISNDTSKYRAVFTNPAGSVTSTAATLTVRAVPVVTANPLSTTVQVGEAATFEASASGYPTPTVQWQVSSNSGSTWTAIEGATSTTLTIASPQLAESGHEFRAVFTNATGSAATTGATMTVASNKFSAVAWGENLYRQLGSGSPNALIDVPVEVSALKFVTAVAAGGLHSLALLANGTVVAWGDNENGQLGDGTTVLRETPVPVAGLSGVKAIAAGGEHSLALLSNGTVMAWGANASGQLGDGTTALKDEPVAVKGLSNVRAIAAGGEHSLALLSNGTVMAWGSDESGQLGNGKNGQSSVPVAVKSLTGAISIAAGDEFSLAARTSGAVEAWGSNVQGQLGNSSVEETSNVPVPVEGLSGVTSVAAGARHALALLSTGTLKAWGEDAQGQLGNGVITAREESPVAVSGVSGVQAIAAGGNDSAALLSSGTIDAWGANHWGTLGDGASGEGSSLPVTVSGVAKASAVSVGGAHMLAYGEPLPVVTGISPVSGPTSGGTTVTISGGNLAGATAVTFGSTEASSFTIESASTITATAPAGSGTVDVRVTTPAGTSAARSTDRFTYQLPPTITKVTPALGPVAGGTLVTITGSEFTAASSVSFGATPAASYKVLSATSITAVAPEESAGIVDVRVTNSAGTSAIATKDRYKFTATITEVSPNAGTTAGGTSVTVTGTGFALGSKATVFKFATSKATSVNCTSSTTCTMLSPAHAAGTVDIKATVNKTTSPVGAADKFTYQ
jgi:alpha-tubulin suppressor-like RCC1 family protein